MRLIGQTARSGIVSLFVACATLFAMTAAQAAPYAALVMDARTGDVIHARNADTRLHPASLTKMMTLYVAFSAIQRGEVTLDTNIRVTAEAAREPPSRLGLQTGQSIRLRYLLRAAAVKSANDAATAIGIAISGSQSAFADRMNATAAAMGLSNTHFVNMHGLTQQGHYSTARDMSVLGRHLVYDFPQYYNLFSRRTADAGIAQVTNTNTRFLDSYRGADGIKTGYTVAAGYNLVASAERDGVRIIATVFGGTSTANRNARVTELLDMGFAAAPRNATVRAPEMGRMATPDPSAALVASAPANTNAAPGQAGPAARTIRVSGLVSAALRPPARPGAGGADADAMAVAAAVAANSDAAVEAALAEALGLPLPEDLSSLDLPATAPVALTDVTDVQEVAALALGPTAPAGESIAALTVAAPAPPPSAAPLAMALAPPSRPSEIIMTAEALALTEAEAAPTEVVARMSANNPRTWGINIGLFNSRAEADRVLIQVAVAEAAVLDTGARRITQRARGWEAVFMGLTRDDADLACRRLQSRGQTCLTIGAE